MKIVQKLLNSDKETFEQLTTTEQKANDIEIEIDSLCDGPCASCDSEADYFKLNLPKRNFTQKCQNYENFKRLFLKLKEREEQCYQLRQEINFMCQHRLHQKFNQIKSVDTQLKTGMGSLKACTSH